MSAKPVRVWEVLHDTDGEGPTGDGTVIARFRRESDATKFAAGLTCYGRPAKADSCDVPRRLAQRWGVA
jgi:hypothetical protein